MSDDAQHRAPEFLKELYAAGHIDEVRLRHPGPPGRKRRRPGAITR
jgi:hypothetical protein